LLRIAWEGLETESFVVWYLKLTNNAACFRRHINARPRCAVDSARAGLATIEEASVEEPSCELSARCLVGCDSSDPLEKVSSLREAAKAVVFGPRETLNLSNDPKTKTERKE
jgi:hypothetical protein